MPMLAWRGGWSKPVPFFLDGFPFHFRSSPARTQHPPHAGRTANSAVVRDTDITLYYRSTNSLALLAPGGVSVLLVLTLAC